VKPEDYKNPMAKSVKVNNIIYSTIKDAALANKYDAGDLSKILKGVKKLNKRIWQAEYLTIS
jgi:hypothetical protein